MNLSDWKQAVQRSNAQRSDGKVTTNYRSAQRSAAQRSAAQPSAAYVWTGPKSQSPDVLQAAMEFYVKTNYYSFLLLQLFLYIYKH